MTKFYRYRRTMQIVLTVCLAALIAPWSLRLVGHPRHGPWLWCAWMMPAALQLSSLWLDYWTVEDGTLVQHSLWSRIRYPASELRYAGPVRQVRWLWALRRSIEIKFAPHGTRRYVAVANRAGFLQAVRVAAAHAEVIG